MACAETLRRVGTISFLLVACARSPEAPTARPRATTIPSPAPDTADPASVPTREAPSTPASTVRTATEPPPTRLDENGDRVPVSFVASELLATLDADAGQPVEATARILTWLVEVDDRPLVIDRAILWVHRRTPGGSDSWELAHFYRHPLDPPPNDAVWHVARVYDVPYVGQRSYSHAPTPKELDDFLNETWWKFRPSDGFARLDAGVCTKAWKLSLGSDPNHGYP